MNGASTGSAGNYREELQFRELVKRNSAYSDFILTL